MLSLSLTYGILCLCWQCALFQLKSEEFLRCSTFPHLLAPNLLPPHSSPQFSSLRADFINPLSSWLPAILLCRTLSLPMWFWARKSIKLLITVGSCSSCVAQGLTQQINAPEPALAGSTGTTQHPTWDLLPRSHLGVAFSKLSGLLPLHPRTYPSFPPSAWET